MSDISNACKTISFGSNKSSRKTIFSINNNVSHHRHSNFNLLKNNNISTIKMKSLLAQKKIIPKNNSKKNNIFGRQNFFIPIRKKLRNNKKNYGNIINPFNSSNNSINIRKKLIFSSSSNISNNISIPNKSMIDQKFNYRNLMNYKNEKSKLVNLIENQKIQIKNLKTKCNEYYMRLKSVEKENIILHKKINNYNNNQEQLILLIKIIQEYGVDIDKLIDKYNNSIYNDSLNEKNSEKNNSEIISDSLSYIGIDSKSESNTFTPLTIENIEKSKISKIKIPKLNFDIIKKKNQQNRNKIYNKIK